MNALVIILMWNADPAANNSNELIATAFKRSLVSPNRNVNRLDLYSSKE